ncbi:MAG: hypothetical protein OXG04_08560 [Acidobacteria bacterium]|nr:hypothetical protein [Acidobacteriota bacterium]
MTMRVSRFVTATLGLVASVLTIWAERAGPLEVVAGLEVGPAGFAVVAAVLLGVFGALVSPTVSQWCLARWSVRQRQFRELAPVIRALRPALIHDDRGYRDQDLALDVEVRLRRLGLSVLSPKTEVDYARFIEMAERGAWREARRRFPAAKGKSAQGADRT